MKLHSMLVSFLFLASCAQVQPVPTSKTHSTDTHMHIHPSAESEELKFNGERALFAANSIGIQRVIVLSNAYSKMAYRDYARTQNSYVAREAKKNHSKIAGACAVNPLMDWAVDEVRRCKQDGLKVLKLHTQASGMDLRKHDDLAELKKVLTVASETKMTVLIHVSLPKNNRGHETEILLKTLADYTKVRLIIGHLSGKEFELMKKFKHPNFLVEVSEFPFSTSESERENVVNTMREIGIKNLVFGSDWPSNHPAELLHALQELPLRTGELEDIVYNNAAALDDLF